MNKKEFKFQPPKKVQGIEVICIEESLTIFRDNHYVTLTPKDQEIEMVWEFCLDTGKILRTI